MPLFESPQQLGNDEIKELQKTNTDKKLDDSMMQRLQDKGKRDLFVSEYKSYLERSKNEASKELIIKLFGNIFDLAKQKGIAMDPDKEDKNNTGEQQGNNIMKSVSSTGEQKFENKEIQINVPLDIKNITLSALNEIKNQMNSFKNGLHTNENTDRKTQIFMQVLDTQKQDIGELLVQPFIDEVAKLNLPVITQQNMNDQNVQKLVIDGFKTASTQAMNTVATGLDQLINNMIVSKKLSEADATELTNLITEMKTGIPQELVSMQNKMTFPKIIEEIKTFQSKIENMKQQATEVININNSNENMLYMAKTDIVVNERNEKELKPHRELATNIIEGLNIDKHTGKKIIDFVDDKGEYVYIQYNPDDKTHQGVTIFKAQNLSQIIAGSVNIEESVTISVTFDKNGKLESPKSLMYITTSANKAIGEQQRWSGEQGAYPKVEEILKSVGSNIVDLKMKQNIGKS